jgi:uncharacterized protein YjiS (DUF1127 family)
VSEKQNEGNIMKMNAKMTDLPRSLSSGGWTSRLIEAILDAHERRAQGREIRKSIRELSQLDDHILKDMGMSRNSIESAVRERIEAERRGRYGW